MQVKDYNDVDLARKVLAKIKEKPVRARNIGCGAKGAKKISRLSFFIAFAEHMKHTDC